MKLAGFFQRSQPEPSHFWEWFVKSEAQIQSVKTGQEPIMNELGKRLRMQHPRLEFEMSVNPAGEREFIVSAGGIRDAIFAVMNLVGGAPAIPGWRIIAFRQRHPGAEIKLGSTSFGPDDIWFSAKPHSEQVNLDLYVKGFHANNKMAMQAAFLFLDATLGEYDVMTKIGNINFHELPADPAALALKPSPELAPFVDAL